MKLVDVYCKNVKPNEQGTTWRARYKSLPSRRFIKFCVMASVELIKFRPRDAT